jgi:hypothetical protein
MENKMMHQELGSWVEQKYKGMNFRETAKEYVRPDGTGVQDVLGRNREESCQNIPGWVESMWHTLMWTRVLDDE